VILATYPIAVTYYIYIYIDCLTYRPRPRALCMISHREIPGQQQTKHNCQTFLPTNSYGTRVMTCQVSHKTWFDCRYSSGYVVVMTVHKLGLYMILNPDGVMSILVLWIFGNTKLAVQFSVQDSGTRLACAVSWMLLLIELTVKRTQYQSNPCIPHVYRVFE
jgi:hypothetical protein